MRGCFDSSGERGGVMYKYLFNDEIHTALGFHEARQQCGRVLPNTIDPVSHFIVRLWRWDETDKEYSIEIFDEPGHQVFNEYDGALTCFNALEGSYPQKPADDVKLELIQYHLGEISTLQSKILFPPMLAGEL